MSLNMIVKPKYFYIFEKTVIYILRKNYVVGILPGYTIRN